MYGFRRNKGPTLTANERTQQKQSDVIYKHHQLKGVATSSKDYVITVSGDILSSSYQARYKIAKGRETYSRTVACSGLEQADLHGQVLNPNERFTPQTLSDYKYRTFDADISRQEIYPTNEPDDGEAYIYNLPIHGYYDNQNNDNATDAEEMTEPIYTTYHYFQSYPYRLDASNQIDYALMDSNPTVDHEFVVANTDTPRYFVPFNLLGCRLRIDTDTD